MIRKLLPALLLASVAGNAHTAPIEGEGVAWDIVEGLTTEIGPRMAGTEAEARARDWAKAKLEALGFANVAIEPFKTEAWTRGEEEARLVAPYAQPLAITALGRSVPTPPGGLKGELVYFPTLAALREAGDNSLKGKIAFVDHAMQVTQDGSGYGVYGEVRRAGPAIASGKGAAGIVIRSIGTDFQRNPHTGATNFPEGTKPIPSGAVSNPDADLIARVASRGQPMRIAMTLTGRPNPDAPSGNVIADLPGRDPSLPMILLACHLDSWDLGTGAIDDASGCGIITGAVLKASKDGQLLRTVRLLWAGNEEMGPPKWGGYFYSQAHAHERHALAMESDFGAGRIWAIRLKLAEANKALGEKIKAAVWPLGIVPQPTHARGGADIGDTVKAQKLALVDLVQDGSRYFDLHHTPDDTLDKIDPVELQQNVDAWAAVLKVVANEPGTIAPVGGDAGE